jgi:DNA-binding CsgD family transcriptional regulator
MLLGRDHEQLALVRLLKDARAGDSGVLALVGEAGIGKSALLAYAEEQAGGMKVLRARGVQSEAHIPFAGLFELLRPALPWLDQIPGPQAAALESALALRPASARDRFAVGAATLSLLAAYADEAPVAVLVDDAHWLDGSSADALLFAFRRLIADPVAVILTVREGEPSLLDGADLAALRLRGLDRASAAELLRRQGDEPLGQNLADRLHHETGGNPLALLELGEERGLLANLPPGAPLATGTSIASVYLLRFRSLPQRTRDALVLAAAIDTGEVPVLARAALMLGLDLSDLVPAEAAALITVHDSRVEFRHPLARSAIYGDCPAERRRVVHRALADALPDADADRRAWHLALASFGPDDAASSALEQAGQRAHQRSAYEVSSRAFERAAWLAPEEVRQGRLLQAAADAAWLGGLADRAGALLDQASRHAPAPELAVSIEQLRGHIATRRGPVTEAQEILLAAAEHAAPIDPARGVVMLAEAVNASFYAGDAATMRLGAERAAALAQHCSGGRTAFFALIAQGMALIFSGEGERGAPAIRAAVEVLEHSDELRDDPRLLAWAAMGPIWLREAHTGRALADRALAVARRTSAVGVLPFVLTHVALDQAATDRWAEAQAGFSEAIGLARETGQRTELGASLARLAWLEARLGRSEQSRQHATEALSLSRELGLGVCEMWAIAALGDLELSLGRPEAALAHFEEQRAVLRSRGILDVDLSPAPELVEIYLRLGRGQEAAQAAADFERDADAKAQPWALARAARCRGLLAAEAESDGHFEAALALHAQTPDAFEAGRTYLAYGSHLRRGRQRLRAREQLRAAVDVFDRLGADPWSAMARAELAATGETARRRDVTTLHDLTPQELQIALSLAAGRTTRETAAALFLSPKTIEYHLRNIYRKLAIGSRSELKAAMARLPAGLCGSSEGLPADRQEALDHQVHLIGNLELMEVTRPHGLADRDRRVGLQQEGRAVGGHRGRDHEDGHLATAQDGHRVERRHRLHHRYRDVIGRRTHALHDLGPALGIVGWQEHLLDEPPPCCRRIRALECWQQLTGEALPHLLAQRRRINHDHRADQGWRLLGHGEPDHRAQAVADHHAPSEAEIMPECRDIRGKSFDRVRRRRLALAMPRQVHADDAVRG